MLKAILRGVVTIGIILLIVCAIACIIKRETLTLPPPKFEDPNAAQHKAIGKSFKTKYNYVKPIAKKAAIKYAKKGMKTKEYGIAEKEVDKTGLVKKYNMDTKLRANM